MLPAELEPADQGAPKPGWRQPGDTVGI